jgi:hypothetical protein
VIIRSDKVPLMAAKTTVLRRPGDIVAIFSVTVQTIPNMAGLKVFLVKVRGGLPKGLFDEPPFPCPRGHHLVKQGIVTLVAADTAPGPIVTGRWTTHPFRVIPMTRRAGQSGMQPFERGMVGDCRTSGQQAQGD